MEVGFVINREIKKSNEIIKWLEMTIRVPFGSCTLTITKRKPRKDGDSDNAPQYDIYFSPNRKGETFDRMKVGSLWMKTSEKGNPYISGYIETPLSASGKMYISIVKYIHQEGMRSQPYLYKVLWSPEEKKKDYNDNYQAAYTPPPRDTRQDTTTSTGIPVEIDISEDDIPF